MSLASSHFDHNPGLPDRRAHLRQPVRSLAYVELGDGNGGIALNIGEGGMAVQAVMSLGGDALPNVRVQLSHSKKQIQVKGRVAWTGDLRKLAGVQFVDLTDETRKQIREWIAIEAPESEPVQPEAEPDPGPLEVAKALAATEAASVLELQCAATAVEEATPVIAETAKRPEPVEFTPRPRTPAAPAASVPPAFVPPVFEPNPQPVEQHDAAGPAVVSMPPTTQSQAEPEVAQIAPRRSAPPVPRTSSFFSAETAVTRRDPTPLPDDRFGFRREAESNLLLKGTPPSSPEKWKMSTWVPIFVVIALGAGWVAGHGIWQGNSQPAQPASSGVSNVAVDAGKTANNAAPAPSAPAEIEVLDSNNHRWMIPMIAPVGRGYAARSGVNAGSGLTSAPPADAAPASPARSQGSPNVGSVAPAASSTLPAPTSSAAAETNSAPPSGPVETHDIAPPQPPASATSADLQPGELIHKVEPDYPASALNKKIEGTVKLLAVIDAAGNVRSAQPLSGPPELIPSAVAAVRQWKYSPTMLGNHAIETQRQVTIVFELSKNP